MAIYIKTQNILKQLHADVSQWPDLTTVLLHVFMDSPHRVSNNNSTSNRDTIPRGAAITEWIG